VRQKLGAAPQISASSVGATDDIIVRAHSSKPRDAAAIANAYASSYIDFRRKQAVDDLLAAGQEIQSKVTDLQRQIDAIDNQIGGSKAAAAQNLGPQRDSLLQQQSLFKERLDQ